MKPADFKSYVFPMLFLKWVSDTWDYEHAQADYGDALNDEIEADYHRFTVPAGTHWRDVTTNTVNLGAPIGRALGRIEQANPHPAEVVEQGIRGVVVADRDEKHGERVEGHCGSVLCWRSPESPSQV